MDAAAAAARDAALDAMDLEGLVDNRLRAVGADEGRAVSQNRHSDRDLLDAHTATDVGDVGIAASAPPPAGLARLEMPLRSDVRDDPAFAGRAFLVRQLLSDAECGEVCAAAERHGLEELLLCGGAKRRCLRVPFRSEALKEVLWRRVAPMLAPIEITSANTHMFLNKGMEGTWEPHGLSDVFRVVRYHPGGHIAPHYDGEWVTDEATRSIKTILLYLSSGYEGGLTRLLDHRDDDVGTRFRETAAGATTACDDDVVGVVPVETGIAIVFDAKMLHEGTELLSGAKWLLRADVVYKQTSRAYAADSARARAVELLNEAEYLEESGRSDLAVRNYRAAYKLCPELEYE